MRRTEALTQIQAQASGVVEDVKSWGETATGLAETVRRLREDFNTLGKRIWRRLEGRAAGTIPDEKLRVLLLKYSEVVEQRDSIGAQIDSFKLYFWEQAPSLPHTAQSLIESFNKGFDERYKPLSSQRISYPVFRQRIKLRKEARGADKMIGDFDMLEVGMSLNKEWKELPEAATYARDWDFGPYQVAFEKEIVKVMSGRS